MSLYTKTSPAGVDAPIQKFQKKLWAALLTKWGMTEAQYLCYGRCYRNQTPEGFKPEMYKADKEYRDLFFDDTLHAISFFGCEEKSVEGGLHKGKAHLIFLVDLSKIKPSYTYRADEEAHQDIYLLLKNWPEFEITEEISGIDRVFREYSGWNKPGGIQYLDMQPFHCFRFNVNIIYQPSACVPAAINNF